MNGTSGQDEKEDEDVDKIVGGGIVPNNRYYPYMVFIFEIKNSIDDSNYLLSFVTMFYLNSPLQWKSFCRFTLQDMIAVITDIFFTAPDH